MRISELLDGNEFSFNARYRIYRYDSDIENDEGELTLMYDSEGDMEYDWSINSEEIIAINQAEDGALEIEYAGGTL